jgi:hypothetical protein
MNTNIFPSLKQMQTTTDSNTRYLLADDMNLLISEVIANVEMSDVTDAGYVSHDDQALIRDLIKNRIAINQEILLGHKAKQWDSVYWNSDNIRSDLTVKLLNEELSRQDNQGSDEKQIEIDSDQCRLNEFVNIRFNSSFDDDLKTFSKTNDTGGNNSTDDDKSKTTLTDNQSSNTRDNSSRSAKANSHQQGNSVSSSSHSRTVNNHDGSSDFLFGGSRCSSSDVSSSNQNSQSNSNREFSDKNDRNVIIKVVHNGKQMSEVFEIIFSKVVQSLMLLLPIIENERIWIVSLHVVLIKYRLINPKKIDGIQNFMEIDSIPNLLVASFTERDLILEHFLLIKLFNIIK